MDNWALRFDEMRFFTANLLITAMSNQIIFIGLRSSKNYYKRPGGGVGIWEGSLGREFFAWVDVC